MYRSKNPVFSLTLGARVCWPMRIETRQQADELVRGLPKRTRTGLAAALEDRRASATRDPFDAYRKELVKRLKLGLDFADLGAIAWALVGAGLVERQSEALWDLLASGVVHGTLADLELLLDGVSAPGETSGTPFRSSYFPEWSAALDLVCFGICKDDLSPLVTRHAAARGPMRIGLGGLLVRAGLAGGREDWAGIFARYFHFFGDASPAVVATDAEGDHVLWPAHPDARAFPWAPGRRRVVPRESAAPLSRPYVRELVACFCDLGELRARLDDEALSPTAVRRPRPKGRPPAALAAVPSYAELAWVYGRRVRDDDPARIAGTAREVAEGALDFGPQFPGAGLYGAFEIPLSHTDEKSLAGGANDAVVGTILNGSPIVRSEPEMREGILATLHEVTAVQWKHLGDHLGIQDVHTSHETTWDEAFRAILDDAMPDRSPVAWHLVARKGRTGALVYGCLLPGTGDSYEDDLVSTRLVRDETGSIVARLVGASLATVDAETPVATLEGPVGDELGRRVVERITALTGRARPCQTYLHRGPGES